MSNTVLRQVVVVHGYTASPAQNWFPWLAEQLEGAAPDVHVSVPEMPNPHAPQPAEWIDALQRAVPQVDEHTHFVGHSLGCIAALLFLRDKHPNKKIGSLTMVSGFGETASTLPELSSFTEPKPSLAFSRKLTSNRIVLTSGDDEIVPWTYSQRLADEMDAPLLKLKTGGHFLDREGYTKFPFLLQIIESFL